jgi:hypothetical protein
MPSELTWIIAMVAGLGVVYFMAFSFLLWAQRLDDVCVVLKHEGRAKPLTPPLGNDRQGVSPGPGVP